MINNFKILTFQKIAETSGISPLQKEDITTSTTNIKSEITLAEIIKEAGALTNLVRKHLAPITSDFKTQFLKLPAGPAREELVYNEIIRRKPFAKMVPITVDGPNGTKITYKVMPDYITLDGLRVPMAGATAQKVANYFGMSLPTSKMSKQIWDAADLKIRPPPLSSGGFIGGKYYSGKEVVDKKISDSDSAIAYSEMIESEIEKSDKAELVAGHMKDVIMPEGDPNKLGLYGWYGKEGKPIQYSAQTPHDTTVHTEYGAGVRLVDKNITITTPDGKSIKTTMDTLLSHPEMYAAVSKNMGAKKYNV